MYKLVKIESSVKVLTIPRAMAGHDGAATGVVKESAAAGAEKQHVCVVRRQRVMMDSEAAALYGIELAELNEQVRKNKMRFPGNYMFQLTDSEYNSLVSQAPGLRAAVPRKQPPHVFTERGVVMLAMILGSYRAMEMAFAVVDDFIRFGTSCGESRQDGSISSLVMNMAGAALRHEKKYGFGSEGNNAAQEAEHVVVYGQQH